MQPDVRHSLSAAYRAVCFQCGHESGPAVRCASCGGPVILSRTPEAERVARGSSPDFQRAMSTIVLPGITAVPSRNARVVSIPEARASAAAARSAKVRSRKAAAPAGDEQVPNLRGRVPLVVTTAATLLSATVVGLLAAILNAGL